MLLLRDLTFPLELYYDAENNIWARPEADGSITVGVTSLAGALAGDFVLFTPKPAGWMIQLGRACALLETGKTVGSVRAPVTAEILAANEELERRPILVNRDPYGAGWLLRMRPANWSEDAQRLVTGAHIEAAFTAVMDHYAWGGA